MQTLAEYSRPSRRAALRLLAGTCLTSLLAACAAPQPSTPTAGTSSPPTAATSSGATASISQPGVNSTPASQPRPGGTLRTANSSDIATLDPFQFSSNAT